MDIWLVRISWLFYFRDGQYLRSGDVNSTTNYFDLRYLLQAEILRLLSMNDFASIDLVAADEKKKS